jgi:hypothetical protein
MQINTLGEAKDILFCYGDVLFADCLGRYHGLYERSGLRRNVETQFAYLFFF